MKPHLALSCVFLCAFGASAFAAGPAGTEGGASLAALIDNSAQGGPQLRATIINAVEANPALARKVSAEAASLRAPQQQAVGAGLAAADRHFAELGTNAGLRAERQIESAMEGAPPGVVAGYALTGGTGTATAIPDAGYGPPNLKECISEEIHEHKHYACHLGY